MSQCASKNLECFFLGHQLSQFVQGFNWLECYRVSFEKTRPSLPQAIEVLAVIWDCDISLGFDLAQPQATVSLNHTDL